MGDGAFSNDLRAHLARITQNFVTPDEEEDERWLIHYARGFVASSIPLPRNNVSVKIHEDPMHRLHYGAQIWRCCRFLCTYFDERPVGFYQGTRILELGAGTAFASLALAYLGARVLATDTKMALPLILHNIMQNPSIVDKVSSHELEWYEPTYLPQLAPPYDYLVASDVIYNCSSHRALANVIATLATDKTIVYVAYQERGVPGAQEKFFEVMKDKGFAETQRFTKTEDGGEEGILFLHIVLLAKAPVG